MLSGGRLAKIQATNRPDRLCLHIGSRRSKAAQKKRKRNGYGKTKARQRSNTEAIYFIDASKTLEILMVAAMSYKMVTRKRLRKLRETVASEDTNPHKKIKCACIVETYKSKRKRHESTLPRNHEDHIAEKGSNSINNYNLVHKFIPMPQAMKIPSAKRMRKFQLGSWIKCTARKMTFWKHKRRKGKSTLPH